MIAMATIASSSCAACSPSRSGTSGGSRCSARATASASSRSITPSSAICSVFASEAKALLPFLPEIDTDPAALAEYLTFQYTIGEADAVPRHQAAAARTRAGGRERPGSRSGAIGTCNTRSITSTAPRYFERRLAELLDDSVCGAFAQRRAGRRLCLGRHRFEPDRDPRRQDRARHRRLLSRPLHRISRAMTRAPMPRPPSTRPAPRLHIDRHHRRRFPRSYRAT